MENEDDGDDGDVAEAGNREMQRRCRVQRVYARVGWQRPWVCHGARLVFQVSCISTAPCGAAQTVNPFPSGPQRNTDPRLGPQREGSPARPLAFPADVRASGPRVGDVVLLVGGRGAPDRCARATSEDPILETLANANCPALNIAPVRRHFWLPGLHLAVGSRSPAPNGPVTALVRWGRHDARYVQANSPGKSSNWLQCLDST